MIYYFKGNRLRGIDLIGELEDISIARQKRIIEKKCNIPKGRYKEYPELRRGYYIAPANVWACEGERENRLYYLQGTNIYYCKLKSLKSFLIQLFGKNIDKQ